MELKTNKKISATFEAEHKNSYINASVRQNFLREVDVVATSGLTLLS